MNSAPLIKSRESDPAFRFFPGAILLLVLLGIAYQPVWNAGFVWDDPEQLVNNEAVKSPDGLKLIWTTVGLSPQYYPLTFSAFWLQHKMWGMNPRGYHVVNVLLMWVVSVLLWRLFRRLGSPVAWWGACLFALHPVNVMSVAWVTELKNVLSGTFILLSILAYLPALENRGRISWSRIAVVFVLYALAMFAKTASSFIPVTILLLHAWRGVRVSFRTGALIAGMVFVAISLSVVTIKWEAMTKLAVISDFDLTAAQRWVIFGQSFWFYLYKVLWPVNLCFFYERWEVAASPPVWQLMIPVSVIVLWFVLWLKRKAWGGGAWVVMTHYTLTTAAVILFHVLYMTRYTWVTDHWQFFGLLGLIPALITLIHHVLPRGLTSKRVWNAGASVVMILFIIGARAESAKYRDAETLYQHVLVCNPKSWLVFNNLGHIYDLRGNKQQAIECYLKSLELRPDNVEAVNNLGGALADIGKPAEAEQYFRATLELQPTLPGVRNNLGRVLAMQDKLTEAREVYLQALASNPRDVVSLEGLGIVLARMSHSREAAKVFEQMLQASPGNPTALAYLGQIHVDLGEHAKAMAYFEAYFRGSTIQPEHLNTYAWIAATSEEKDVINAEKAGSAAHRAVSMDPENPWYWGTLAAAQSEGNRHADAIRSADRAIELAMKKGDEKLAAEVKARKAMYQSRQEKIAP